MLPGPQLDAICPSALRPAKSKAQDFRRVQRIEFDFDVARRVSPGDSSSPANSSFAALPAADPFGQRHSGCRPGVILSLDRHLMHHVQSSSASSAP